MGHVAGSLLHNTWRTLRCFESVSSVSGGGHGEEESEAKRGAFLFGSREGGRFPMRGGGMGRTGVGKVSGGGAAL